AAQLRHTLPRPAQARAGRVHQVGMAPVGEQSARQVLRPDRRGAEATGAGNARMARDGRPHRRVPRSQERSQMRYVRSLLARITGSFTKDTTDEDLRAEMEAHLDMEIAENIRRGMDPDEARRQAILASGGITQASEAVRDQRGLPLIESLAADMKYAFRALRHARGFSAVVVLTLALGIGANTAIFSVIRGVLLKPLPHREGDRLVYLRQSAEIPGGANLAFSVPEVK